MNRSSILKIVLSITILILVGNAIAISRDYQDSWILEGLEIPFILFIAIYALAFFSEKKLPSLVLLAVIGRLVFLLIPTLKYDWFIGTAIDQQMQFALANHVRNMGYIATSPNVFHVLVYGRTPLIHINFAIFANILSLPVVDSFKYMPVFLSPLYPILTYVVMKNSKFFQGDTALKCTLFISSVPATPEKYMVTGSQFGFLLSFLILGILVTLFQKKNRRHFFIFIFFIFVLAATHSASSIILTTFLLVIFLLQKISYFRLKSYLKLPEMFAVILICVTWLIYQADFTFKYIVHLALLRAPAGTTPQTESISLRFFELAQVDALAAAKTVLVYYGADIFLLLLTLAGLLILSRRLKQLDNSFKFLYLVCGMAILYIPIGLLAAVGPFRALHFAGIFFPIFIGVLIFRKFKRKRWLVAIILSLIVLFGTLQLYTCQPLIPSANILLEDLPANEPIVYVNNVNSIYQRQLIKFAGNYIRGQIACDMVTKNQIVGLTELNFSIPHLAYYYPLDKSQLEREYDCFLIHLPGVSGRLFEQAEKRTRNLIFESIYNSNVIYTNGESYALTNNPT